MDESEIIKQVEKQVEEELREKFDKKQLGYIHIFEKRKKELLKERGIDWKTSREKYTWMTID